MQRLPAIGKSLGVDYARWLTRGTVWAALSLYVTAEITRWKAGSSRSAQIARVLNNLGCAAFVVHVACAFQFYHHWSHAAAYADTARQTKDYFGLDWGGGLYLNYVFLVVWVGQAIRSWIVGPDSPRKTDSVVWGLRMFVLVMVFNGAVIFAHGPIRWFGVLLCLALVWCWWPVGNRQ